MNCTKYILPFLLLLASFSALHGQTNYYVDEAGDDLNDGLTAGTPKLTLQNVFNTFDLNAGDVIHVATGNYSEYGITNGADDEGYTIQGAGTTNTIFDGGAQGRFILFNTGSGITIKDMRIEGYEVGEASNGGAFSIDGLAGDGFLFENIIFRGCQALDGMGGAISVNVDGLDFDVKKCVFYECTATSNGSAIAANSCGSVNLVNSLFYKNDANGDGDFYIGETGNLIKVYNCTFADNLANLAATIVNNAANLTVTNTILYNNATSDDIGAYGGSTTLNYCIIKGGINGVVTNNNDVSGNPYFRNAALFDYGLTHKSVARDAGTSGGELPTDDIEGTTRSTNDIGAYEWKCSPNAGSISGAGSACPSDTTTMNASGFDAKHLKWQMSTDNSNWGDIAGATDTNKLVVTNLNQTTYYRLAASCDNATWVNSGSSAITVGSNDVYVSTSGSNANDGTSPATAWANLTYAIDQAQCGDTINVLTGTYSGSQHKNMVIDTAAKDLLILGAGMDQTIFDGGTSGRFMEFVHTNIKNITFRDMKIQNTFAIESDGGAFNFQYGKNISLEKIHFSNCEVDENSNTGGAINASYGVTAGVHACIIEGGNANKGGAIHWEGDSLSISNSLIYENNSLNSTIELNYSVGKMEIWNSTIVDNTNSDAIVVNNGTIDVKNSIVTNNTNDDFDVTSGMINVDYCLYQSYVGANVSNSTVGTPSFISAANDVYGLLPTSAGVDAGTNTNAPTYDFTGDVRLTAGNTVVDMGAIEQANYDPPCLNSVTVTWDGSTSSSWKEWSNWDLNMIPCGNPVVIPDVVNDPSLDTIGKCGDLTLNGAANLALTGNDSLVISGNLTLNSTSTVTHTGNGVVIMDGLTKNIAVNSGTGLSSVKMSIKGSVTPTATVQFDSLLIKEDAAMTVSGNITISNNLRNEGTISMPGSVDQLVVNGNFRNASTGSFIWNGGATLDVNGSLINEAGASLEFNTSTLQVAGGIDNYGTINGKNGYLTLDGSTKSVVLQGGMDSLYSLTISKANGTDSVIINEKLVVDYFYLNDGIFKSAAVSDQFTVRYNADLNGGELIERNNGGVTIHGSLMMNNDAVITTSGNESAEYLHLGGNIDINGTAAINHSGPGQIVFHGATSNFYVEPTANVSSMCVNVSAAGDYTFNDDVTIDSLILTGSGEVTVASSKILTVMKDLYIASTSGKLTLNGDLMIGGDYRNLGDGASLVENTSTVTFMGTGSGELVSGLGETFYNVIMNKTSLTDTFKLGNMVNAMNVFTVKGGTMHIPSSGISAFDSLRITGGKIFMENGIIQAENNMVDMQAGEFQVLEGTVDFDNGGGNTDLNISGGKFQLDGGTLDVGDGMLLTGGEFEINGGNLNVLQQYDAYGLENMGGTFDVNGGIVNIKASYLQSSTSVFEMGGGTLNIGVTVDGIFDIYSGTYNLTGGVIDIKNAHVEDFEVQIGAGATMGTVTGGTIKMSATDGNTAFKINPSYKVYNVEIDAAGDTAKVKGMLNVVNDITITNGVFFADSIINLEGDWINNSSTDAFEGLGSTVSFMGSDTQFVKGTYDTEFDGLKINNSSSVTLQKNVTVSDTLNLNVGNINTTWSTMLKLDNGAADAEDQISGGSATSYINGPIKIVDYAASGASLIDTIKVIVGDAGHFSPFAIIPTNSNSTTWEGKYNASDATSLTATKCVADFNAISNKDYYDIQRATGTADARLLFQLSGNSMITSADSMKLAVLLQHNSGTPCWGAVDADTAQHVGDWAYSSISTDYDVTTFDASSKFTFGMVLAEPDCPDANFRFKGMHAGIDSAGFCLNDSIILEDSSIADPFGFGTGIADRKWMWIGQDTIVTTSDTNVWKSNLPTGTYDLRLVVRNDIHLECKDSASKKVTINGLPSLSVYQNDDIDCYGGNGAVEGMISAHPYSPYRFKWSEVAGGSILRDTTRSENTDILANQPAGVYFLELTDAQGCADTGRYSLIDPAKLVIDAGNDTTICNTNAFTTTSTTSGGTGGVTFAWTPSINVSDETLLRPDVTVSTATKLDVTATDSKGCTALDSLKVDVNLMVTDTIDTILCIDSNFTIAGQLVSSATTVYDTIQYNNGICDSIEKVYRVTMQPKATFDVTKDTMTCGNREILLEVTNPGGAYTYQWFDGEATSSKKVTAAGSYAVTVTDAMSCGYDTTINVAVDSNFTMPELVVDKCDYYGPYTSRRDDYEAYMTTFFTDLNATYGTGGYYADNQLTIAEDFKYHTRNAWHDTTYVKMCKDNYSVVIHNFGPSLKHANLELDNQGGMQAEFNLTALQPTIYPTDPGDATYEYYTDSLLVNLIASPSMHTSGTDTVYVKVTDSCISVALIELKVNIPPVERDTIADTICNGDSVQINGKYQKVAGFYSDTLTGHLLNDSIVVTDLAIRALPVFDIDGVTEFCAGSSTNIWVDSSDLVYNWSTLESTQSITVNAAGTYQVTVTKDGCDSTASVMITEHALPSYTFTGDTAVCNGDTSYISIPENYDSYVWSGIGDTNQVKLDTAKTYSVIVTDSNSCSKQEQVIVTWYDIPSISFTGNMGVCEGDTTNILITETHDQYNWTGIGDTNLAGFDTAGTYYVEVVDTNGCRNNDSLLITQFLLPEFTVEGDKEYCAGDSTNVYVVPSNGNFNYAWSNGKLDSSIHIKTAGAYTVTVSGANCFVDTTITIIENASPSADAGIDQTVCRGDSVLLKGASNLSSVTFSWSHGITDSVRFAADSTRTYEVIVETDKFCQTKSQMILTVLDIPTIGIVGSASEICYGDAITLTANVQYASNYTYSAGWVSATEFTPDSVGTFPYGLVVDNGVCAAGDTFEVKINALPNPIISTNKVANTICEDDTIQIMVTDGELYSYYHQDTLLALTNDPFVNVVNAQNGDRIHIVVMDENNCYATTDTVRLVVEDCFVECPEIVAFFNYKVNDYSIEVVDSSAGPIDVYTWNLDGQIENGDTAFYSMDSAGFYDICLTVFDSSSNCSHTTCRTVEVADTTSDTNVVIPVVCNADFEYDRMNDTIVFRSKAKGTHNKYRWEFGDGTNGVNDVETHVYENAGFYEVCFAVFDSVSACTDQICKTIEVIIEEDSLLPVCQADFTFHINLGTKEVNFTNHSDGDISMYFWDFGNGYYSKNAHPSFTYADYGQYNVTLTTFDTLTNCQSEVSKMVDISDTTTVRCYSNFTYFIDDSNRVHFNNTSSGTISEYYWILGDGGLSIEENPIHRYAPGHYKVILNVYDKVTGCHNRSIREVEIIRESEVYCKAEFSHFPNDDGSVTFSSLAKGTYNAVRYDFGDNTFAEVEDTVHQFDQRAYYNVCYKVIDTALGCLDKYCEDVLGGPEDDTTEVIENCKAAFEYYPDGLTGRFRNLSTGNYKQAFWEFGDQSNLTSLEEEITHTFAEGGYYEVTLVVVDTETSCFDTYREVVAMIDTNTNQSENCLAAFTYFIEDSGYVKFKETTKGNIDKYYWNFGDGKDPVFGPNPVHKYRKFGYYEVCLTVYNKQGCSDTYCEVIGLGDLKKACYADFEYFVNDDGYAQFINTSLGRPMSYHWDFGDSVTSQQIHPGHSYAQEGLYGVCLTVQHDSGCTRVACEDVVIGEVDSNRCLYNCVWPGDANGDLEANHYDVLSIGLNYGQEGPRRDSVDISWKGHGALPWASWQYGGINNMHADCNGDGVISAEDTNAIRANFAKSHYRQYRKTAASNQLTLEVEGDIEAGGTVVVHVNAGQDGDDLAMYGVGFELGFQDGDIDYESFNVNWNDTWLDNQGGEQINNDWGGDDEEESDDLEYNDWGGDDEEESDDLSIDWIGDDEEESDDLSIDWIGDDEEESDDLWANDLIDENDQLDLWVGDEVADLLMTFHHEDETSNVLMIAGTRTDNRNVTGGGRLVTVTFKLKSTFSKDDLLIDLFTEGGIEATGEDVEFENDQLSVSVQEKQDVFQVLDLNLYPNPTNATISFTLSDHDEYTLELFDSFGKLILSKNDLRGGFNVLDLSDISIGTYNLRIVGNNSYYNDRITIVR